MVISVHAENREDSLWFAFLDANWVVNWRTSKTKHYKQNPRKCSLADEFLQTNWIEKNSSFAVIHMKIKTPVCP